MEPRNCRTSETDIFVYKRDNNWMEILNAVEKVELEN